MVNKSSEFNYYNASEIKSKILCLRLVALFFICLYLGPALHSADFAEDHLEVSTINMTRISIAEAEDKQPPPRLQVWNIKPTANFAQSSPSKMRRLCRCIRYPLKVGAIICGGISTILTVWAITSSSDADIFNTKKAILYPAAILAGCATIFVTIDMSIHCLLVKPEREIWKTLVERLAQAESTLQSLIGGTTSQNLIDADG